MRKWIMQIQIARLSMQRPHRQNASNLPRRKKNQLEEKKIELMNTLRWEDDGGRFVTSEKTETLLNDLRQ
jgi:hypothetical protein